MLFSAIDLLTTDIEALGWVERYGRLTRPVTILTHQGIEDEEKFYKTLPVSCSVSLADCQEGNTRYYAMTPDSSKKSVAYWEQQSGFTFTYDEGDGFLTGSAVARFVGWLNLTKLGKTDCTITADVVAPLLQTLNTTKRPTSGVFTNGSVRFELIEQVQKDEAIFSEYTYDNQETGYLLFPYDFFAVDVAVTLKIDRNCFTAFTTAAEVSCQTY